MVTEIDDNNLKNSPSSKGKPTPKQKDVVRANKRPLIGDNQKLSKEKQRAANKEQRQRENLAMRTGDEANMPAMHKGNVRRYIRDYVDARRSIGQAVIPIILAFLVASLLAGTGTLLAVILTLTAYLYLFLSVIDAVIMWKQLKKRLILKFGESKTLKQGHGMYAGTRAFQLRATRNPAPQVKYGQYPI